MAEADPVGFIDGAGLGAAARAEIKGLNAARLLKLDGMRRARSAG
jgi:hypothetical protein